MTATIEYDTKQTAAALRRDLHAAHPGVKFSVRMATGTAYGWLRVAWTDGPTEETIHNFVRRYQSSYFDGMDDGYHSIDASLAVVPGHAEPVLVRWSCRGVNVHRTHSAAHEATAAAMLAAVIPAAFTDGEPSDQPWGDTVWVDLPGADEHVTLPGFLSPAAMVGVLARQLPGQVAPRTKR